MKFNEEDSVLIARFIVENSSKDDKSQIALDSDREVSKEIAESRLKFVLTKENTEGPFLIFKES